MKNTPDKSYKCNEIGKVIHEPCQCTPHDTSDTSENYNKYRFGNHRDASVETCGNTGEEPCKYIDFVSCLNWCSIII